MESTLTRVAEDRVKSVVRPVGGSILLLGIGLLTMILVAGCAELAARSMFRETRTSALDCLVLDDSTTGVRGTPNCVCSQKIFEEPTPTEYRFNNCGHRMDRACGPKAAGAYRIVLVGSSMAEGLRVPRNRTFAALLPAELSRKTGREIELYNQALMFGTPRRIALGFKEVLAARPDMILWTVTPWDLEHILLTDVPWLKRRSGVPAAAVQTGTVHKPASLVAIWNKAVDKIDKNSRAVFMLKYFLYRSQTQYVKSFLKQGEGAQFLRARTNPNSQEHLRQFDTFASEILAQANAAGVPVVVTVLPQRAQAAMISMGTWAAGFDPYVLGNQVRSAVESHGGSYVDILHGFRSIANPERDFLTMDGHPNAGGHAIFTHLLANGLTAGAAPGLHVNSNSLSTAEIRGRETH